jgi:hypothetical protein
MNSRVEGVAGQPNSGEVESILKPVHKLNQDIAFLSLRRESIDDDI